MEGGDGVSNRTDTWLFNAFIYLESVLCLCCLALVSMWQNCHSWVTGDKKPRALAERDWNLACSEQVSSSVHDGTPQGEVQSRSPSIILAAGEVLCISSSWCGHSWAVPGRRKVSATTGAGVASHSHST